MDTNRLNKLICKASYVMELELDSVGVVSERRMLSKYRVILDNVCHSVYGVLVRVYSVKDLVH